MPPCSRRGREKTRVACPRSGRRDTNDRDRPVWGPPGGRDTRGRRPFHGARPGSGACGPALDQVCWRWAGGLRVSDNVRATTTCARPWPREGSPRHGGPVPAGTAHGFRRHGRSGRRIRGPFPAASVAVERTCGNPSPWSWPNRPRKWPTPLSEPIPTPRPLRSDDAARRAPFPRRCRRVLPCVESSPGPSDSRGRRPCGPGRGPAPPPGFRNERRLFAFGQDWRRWSSRWSITGRTGVRTPRAFVIPALAPCQAATVLPDASTPAAPESRILAATPRAPWGRLSCAGMESVQAAARLYGHASKRVMSDLARANPTSLI
jgi:hypothetical protein